MLNVSVISPEAVLFEGTADSVVAPAFDGEVGILTGHAPMMTLLGAGELRLAYETLELSDADDQRLIVYLPADDASAAALDRLTGRRPGALRSVPDRTAIARPA